MSVQKASRGTRAISKIAVEYRRRVNKEGRNSGRGQARIKSLARQIADGWDANLEYDESVQRMAKHGPRTKAEIHGIGLFIKRLRTLIKNLRRARGVDEFTVPAALRGRLEDVMSEARGWLKQMRKASKMRGAMLPEETDQAGVQEQDREQERELA